MQFVTVVTTVQTLYNGTHVHTMHGIGASMTDANAAALEALKKRLRHTYLSDDQRRILFDLGQRAAHLEAYINSLNKMQSLQAHQHGFSISENV